MKNDYIPLAQSSSSRQALEDDYENPQDLLQLPKRRHSSRRRVILGSVIIAFVLAFFFIASELVDYTDDFYDDDESDFLLDHHSAYIPFEPPRHETSDGDVKPIPYNLTPTQELPDHCRDDYFSLGMLCYDPDIKPMDIVWTWVNGSDTLLQDAKLQAQSRFSEDDPYRPKTAISEARQYRDNDELRHSMRSVLANFRLYTRRFQLITSDFRIPDELGNGNTSYPSDWRLGQIPQWLDTTKHNWTDEDVGLSIVHHADIFKPYIDTNFNSYAIESQFSHLQDVTEHFIYLNDDFYMSNPLTPRTFYTSVFGTVLRMDLAIMVSPNKPPADEPHGEWRSMGESNVLLSNRFGARYRPYVLHEAKAVSLAIVRELSAMWAPHLATAATHPFRETVSGAGDVSMLFLMAHFMIERWREALLWSWTVARHGGLGDEWTEYIMQNAWVQLGGAEGARGLLVKAGHRETLEDDRVKAYFKASGHRQADKTWYQFSSWDGYPYAYVDGENHQGWPSFRPYESFESLPECSLSYDECFLDDSGELFNSATDVFKHIAFRKPKCGDCAIQALVRASGMLGLEAFLPSPHRSVAQADVPISDRQEPNEVPHLSMQASWQDADFRILSVMDGYSETNVRAWTLKLLQRYRFVIGYTPYAFVMLETQDNTHGALGWIDSYTDASLLCINDDVKPGEEAAASYFKDWQDRRWSRHAAWERRRR